MTDPLQLLLADGVIDEVLGRLKSGKEANISLVRRQGEVVAAKVYKDRATRSFKNNSDYKEGRKVRNSRTQRAIDGGGRFGRDAAEEAWKSAEATALYRLVDSGVRVPRPVMFYESVLLMELVIDGDGRPAPRLIDVAIDPVAACGVFADLVAQMISMLCCDLIHGDLSPYNILAAADGPTIIDFPQVISAVHNSRAEFFFLRDFDNVLRFLTTFDPSLSAHRSDGRAIWRAYVSRDLTPEFVPPPPPPAFRHDRPNQRSQRGGRPPPRGDRRPDPRQGQRRPDQRSDSRPGPRSDQGPSSRPDPGQGGSGGWRSGPGGAPGSTAGPGGRGARGGRGPESPSQPPRGADRPSSASSPPPRRTWDPSRPIDSGPSRSDDRNHLTARVPNGDAPRPAAPAAPAGNRGRRRRPKRRW